MAPCGQPGEKHCEVGGSLAGNDEEVQVEQGVKYIQTHVEPEAVMPIRSRATPLGGQKKRLPTCVVRGAAVCARIWANSRRLHWCGRCPRVGYPSQRALGCEGAQFDQAWLFVVLLDRKRPDLGRSETLKCHLPLAEPESLNDRRYSGAQYLLNTGYQCLGAFLLYTQSSICQIVHLAFCS